MNKESLGKRYKRGNDIYECIAYTDKPTATLRNIATDEKVSVVVGSMMAEEFEESKKIEKDLHSYGAYPDEILYEGIVKKVYEIIDKINNMEE